MADPNLVIRQARREDAARLHELHTTSVRTLCAPHYSPEIINGWLNDRNAQGYMSPIERGAIFVAEKDGAIIGFGETASGVIVAVYVDPSSTRQGVGSAILRHATTMANHNHLGAIRVESTLNARRFYERHGFREVGRSNVKRNQVEVPIIIMEMPVHPSGDANARKSAARRLN